MGNSLEQDGFENKDLCALCGGDCCRIYEQGHLPRGKSIAGWSEEFHSFRFTYDVKPLFWPQIVHRPENAHLLSFLRSKGIDPFACEYLSPKGCILPWEQRPSQCVAFRCSAFKQLETVG
ncbi:MAG TPA: hypothetical protein P5560_05140 [Thermotogota bacterium]|nr:hypothetical protein [Thermotogota bacterium]HRW92322.1 hypothetical protein [Thermotogota bacterium]